MFTRIVLYSTLGFLLDALGHDVASWQFWCVVGLFWANEHLARMDTIHEIEAEVERLKAERKEKSK